MQNQKETIRTIPDAGAYGHALPYSEQRARIEKSKKVKVLTNKEYREVKNLLRDFGIKNVEIPEQFSSEIAFETWKHNTIMEGLKDV